MTTKTGGRKKGTPNKRTLEVQERLSALNFDPIEGMVVIAKQSMADGDLALAGAMCKELAQYVAPKRKAIEVSADLGPAVDDRKYVIELVSAKDNKVING